MWHKNLVGGGSGTSADAEGGLITSTQAPPASIPPRKGISPPPPRKSSTEATKAVAEAIKEPAQTPKLVTLKLPIAESDSMDVPPGQVRRQVGDVLLWQHKEYMVVRVSASRCIAESIIGYDKISISTCCDKQDVIRREENFQPQKSGAVGTTKQTGIKENNNMKNKGLIKFVKASTAKGISEAEIIKAGKDFEATPAEVKAAIAEAKGGKAEKPKAVKNTSLAGSAEFVGKLHESGIGKTEAREKAEKKFPQFVKEPDAFDRRWATAEKQSKKTSAPAKKSAPVKTAPKKSAPKAKAPKAVVPPPPRPAAEVENPTEQPAE